MLYRDTISFHFDRFIAHAGVTTGALYFFDNKEDLFKNVLIPVTEGAIQILEDYKDHLLVSGERNLGLLWVIKKRSKNSWTFCATIGTWRRFL